jgi:heat shock protein HtpX
MNMLKTTLLMGLLTVLLVTIGGSQGGGRNSVTMAFLLAAGMSFFSSWFSDKTPIPERAARPQDMPRKHSY